MNSYTTQITGLSEITEPLEIGKNYTILITADCNSITKQNNEDGSFTYKHKLKQLTAEITKDNGEVIKVKDKRSQSQKLRGQLWAIGEEKGLNGDEYYEAKMIKIRHYLPEIINFIDKYEKAN